MTSLAPGITCTLPVVPCSCQVAFLGRKTKPILSLIEKKKKKIWSSGSPGLSLFLVCFSLSSNCLVSLIRGHHTVPFVTPGLAQSLKGKQRNQKMPPPSVAVSLELQVNKSFSPRWLTPHRLPLPTKPSWVMTHSGFWQAQKNHTFRSSLRGQGAPWFFKLHHLWLARASPSNKGNSVPLWVSSFQLIAPSLVPENTVSGGDAPGSEIRSCILQGWDFRWLLGIRKRIGDWRSQTLS